MNEEFRKNEISEEELDKVSGGQEINEMPPDWQEGLTPVGAIAEA